MSKRQTAFTPTIKGLQYTTIEQKGEENRYRVSGRDVENNLIHVLGTAEEINNYFKENYDTKELIYLSEDEKIQVCAETINEVFLKLKKEDPLQTEIDVYKDEEGFEAIVAISKVIGSETFDTKLTEALAQYGLEVSSRPSYIFFQRGDKESYFKVKERYKGNTEIRKAA